MSGARRFDPLGETFLTFSAANAQLPLIQLPPEVGKTLLDGGHRPQPSMVSLAGARGTHPALPRLRLAPPDQEVPFHPNISFRGPQALWVQA